MLASRSPCSVYYIGRLDILFTHTHCRVSTLLSPFFDKLQGRVGRSVYTNCLKRPACKQ
uniref:Uncharacterized protein n=1 Tax=Aegilops tauschii subsp. strangulata TaxID=200361 RepID=A0A453BRV8_AEGTS